MRSTLTRMVIPALAGLALTTTAFAQAPGGGGPGGGGGRGGGRAPFTMGPISAVDSAAGTITITPQFGGQGPQTLKIGPATQLVTQSDATVADLKVGDQVQIMGMPTGITATQVMTGQAPAFMQPGGGRGGNAPGGGNGAGGNTPPSQPQATGMAYAVGKVFNTNPLTIAINDNLYVTLKLAPNGKVTRYTSDTIGDLKVGDRIVGSYTTGDDGSLTATSVGVNLAMGGAGMGRGGGRGGFGGGQGFGGPGGGFGGPGGGRANGRRNRGGGPGGNNGGGNNGGGQGNGAPAGDAGNANANATPAGNGGNVERENTATSGQMEKEGNE